MSVVGADELILNKLTTGQYNQYSTNGTQPQIERLDDGGWVVTFMVSNAHEGGSGEVFQRRFDADGNPLEPSETLVNTIDSLQDYAPKVTALDNGGWLVTWCGQGNGTSFTYAQEYGADGDLIGENTEVAPVFSEDRSQAALSNGGWVSTWTEYTYEDGEYYSDIYMKAYLGDGEVVERQIVNTITDWNQSGAQVSVLSDEDWVITWSSYRPNGNELDYQLVQRPYSADGTQKTADDVILVDFTAEGIGDQKTTVLANGGWVVTYTTSGDDTESSDIFQIVFDSEGNRVAAPIHVNHNLAGYQYEPTVIALADGGYVVAWRESTPGVYNPRILQQVFDEHGNPVASTDEFVGSNQTDVSYGGSKNLVGTALPDGGWVIVWCNQSHVMQAVYDSDGQLVETGAVSQTGRLEGFLDVAALDDDGWVVTWMGVRNDNGNTAVYQRVFHEVNDAPIVTNPIADQTPDEHQLFSFQVPANAFEDPNSHDKLSYTATLPNGDALPSWLHFDAVNRTFFGTPANGDVGTISVKVTATDGSNASVSDTFDITVGNTNDPPTLAHALADQAATQDEVFSFQFAGDVFADVDAGDTLAYSATLANGDALPSWLHFDASTRTFSGTPGNGEVGAISVKVAATDGSNASVSDTFDITVANVNDAPSDIVLSGTSLDENSSAGTIIGTLSGIDIDVGDSVSFSLAEDPGDVFAIVGDKLVLAEGAKIDFETRKSYTITVRATDQSGLTYDEDFVIKVLDVNEPITGGPKNDDLFGGKADDILQGLGGNDMLDGNAGADELDGGKGGDTASYASAKKGVTVNLAKSAQNRGDADGDSYISIENLLGSNFADKLTGNGKANTVDGGKGNDTLTGGGGADIFIFGAKYGKDTVTDFDAKGRGHDVIDLSDAVGIADFKDLMSHHIKDIGDDLQITAADGSKLILADVEIKDLVKADFLF